MPTDPDDLSDDERLALDGLSLETEDAWDEAEVDVRPDEGDGP
jgi:hypothetical protein